MSTETRERRTRWAGPVLLLTFVVIPFVILVFSNTDGVTVSWAGFDWENVPLWLALMAAFVAGSIGTRVFSWVWKAWRRRRRRHEAEAEYLRAQAASADEG